MTSAALNARPRARKSVNPTSLKRHAVNVSLLILAPVALYWQVFLQGKTLIDVSTLNNQLPWGYAAGASNYPYNRRDLTDTYVTREYFVVDAYRDGELPLWNPYTMAGHPIYADGVTRTLSPSLLFYRFFDVPLGYSLARIFELMTGAVLMYVFLVSIGAGLRGSLIGALVFELSAHSILHLTGLGWWGGLMWLPLVILFVDRAAWNKSFTDAALAGLALAGQFLCGYLPNQIYYLGLIVLYYALVWWSRRRWPLERSLRLGKAAALAIVTLSVGLAVGATQWVPSLELLGYSNRRIVGAEMGYIYLPPWYSLTLIFPKLFGAAYDTGPLTLFTALGVSHDHVLYIGIVGLLGAVCSIYWLRSGRTAAVDESEAISEEFQRRKARVRIFIILAIISAVVMMAAPVYVQITRFIPVLQVIRVAVRAGVVLLFAASALAAFGIDSLFSSAGHLRETMVRVSRRLTVVAFLIVVAGVATGLILKFTGFASAEAGRGRIGFLRRTAAVLSPQFLSFDAGWAIPLLLLCVVTLLVWQLKSGRLTAEPVFVVMVALLLADLGWNSFQFDRVYDSSRVYPATSVTDLLKSLPPGRVLVVPSDLESNRRFSATSPEDKIIAPPNTLLPYRIPTVSGKNQQFPRWYREFASLIETQPNLSHVVFDKAESPFFDSLNVRYVLTHEGTAIEGYELLATLEGVAVYENKKALPRAYLASEAVAVGDSGAALEALRSRVVADDGAVLEGTSLNGKFSDGVATIVEDKRNKVIVMTESAGDGLLVLSDNYYPGWRAAIDGAETPVIRANRTMRAVSVPAGSHVVSFEFKPGSFHASVFASLSALLVVMFYLRAVALRRRRSTAE
jgi:hypothetical protein